MFLEKNKFKKYNIEIKKSNKQKDKLSQYSIPSFDLGLDFLGIDYSKNKNILISKLNEYIDDWFKDPGKYLELKEGSSIKKNNNFLEFPSILNNSQITRFKYNPQPLKSPGRKVALIHLMHWNGRIKPYERIINFIRATGLPISTLIHIPAGRGLSPGDGDPADYDMLSPNIGKTIFRARQDIQDIQFMAKHLKEKMGYEQVGLFTYSIGSLRGIIASIINPKFFDFGIFQMVADDFTEAVMEGVATKDIAREIDGRIDYQLLQRLWSTISPGAYSNFFYNLPQNTRIVQCEYDFIFGLENVKRFNDKIKKQRPDIAVEIVPTSHTTFGDFPYGIKVMRNNLRFIYKHTKMKEYKRANIFI